MKNSMDDEFSGKWQYFKGAIAETLVVELAIRSGKWIKREPYEYAKLAGKEAYKKRMEGCDLQISNDGQNWENVEVKYVKGDRLELSRIDSSSQPKWLVVVRLRIGDGCSYIDLKVFENTDEGYCSWAKTGVGSLQDLQTSRKSDIYLTLNNITDYNIQNMLPDLDMDLYRYFCVKFANIMIAADVKS